jgi:hypothetical protein
MKKQFGKYEAELCDVEGRICCYISYRDFCSSLDVARGFGILDGTSTCEADHVISDKTVDKIEDWAIEGGW